MAKCCKLFHEVATRTTLRLLPTEPSQFHLLIIIRKDLHRRVREWRVLLTSPNASCHTQKDKSITIRDGISDFIAFWSGYVTKLQLLQSSSSLILNVGDVSCEEAITC